MQSNCFDHYAKVALIIGIIVIQIGCSIQTGQSTDNVPGNSSDTPDRISTALSTSTIMPLKFTASPTISIPTMTSTFIPTMESLPELTATWTAIPTLSQDKAFEVLTGYFENNGGCKLPCWWGIIPGLTLWQDARTKLSYIGHEIGPFSAGNNTYIYQYSFFVPEEMVISNSFPYFEPKLWVKDGIVKIISLNSGYIQDGIDYSLDYVLETFGKPGEIWVKIITDTQFEPHYELDLFYPQLGLLFNSTGNGQIVEDVFSFCPQEFRRGDFPPAITLFSSLEYSSFATLHRTITNSDTENFQPIKDVISEFDETDFFNTYIQPSTNECIDIDVEKLP